MFDAVTSVWIKNKFYFYSFSFSMARVQSLVGQKIAIYNKDNKILIIKREITTWGHRDLPGWWLELNEDAMAGLEREIVEETWLRVTWIMLVHTAAKTFPDGSHSFFVWYMWTLDSSSEIILSHEHDEYLWIDPNDIEKYNLQEYRVETVRSQWNNVCAELLHCSSIWLPSK